MACVFKKRSACRFLVWKPEENSALGKCKLRWEGSVKIYLKEVGWEGGVKIYLAEVGWEDGVKIYLKEVGWEGIHWIYMAGDRDKCQACMNMAVNFAVP